MLLGLIEWAANRFRTFVENVGVDHRGFDIFMSKQFLHRTNVITGFKQVRGVWVEAATVFSAARWVRNCTISQSGRRNFSTAADRGLGQGVFFSVEAWQPGVYNICKDCV